MLLKVPAIRPAGPDDWPAVAELLARSGLPLEGAVEHLADFLLAVDGQRVVGCAGLERYQTTGLLRSVAVDPGYRGRGLGTRLVGEALAAGRAAGLGEVVLLTETASDYFAGLGFAAIERADAPAAVRESVEFTTACSSAAAAMLLRLR